MPYLILDTNVILAYCVEFLSEILLFWDPLMVFVRMVWVGYSLGFVTCLP